MGQTILREDFFMLFSDNPRVHYKKAQLAEVICLFRFPAILSIDA